jgi:eukaryotic-like serine/threonine-protein kinase
MARDRARKLIGEILAHKYRVERVLGEGGVGVVVLAEHVELGQKVALKFLHDDADPEQNERFMREARAAVRLRSEHSVRVTDVGRLRGDVPYMVMEHLEGEDLSRIVARGPLPVVDAVDYVLQACEAVAEAHALGIIHRDLKPGNLFLTSRVHGMPLVKVLDFGMAKTFKSAGQKSLTEASSVMGTPAYMSPEQLRASKDVDARTDIWALGVCLYELLTQADPFPGVTVPDLIANILTKPPIHIRTVRHEIPEALWRIIARCLEKEPNDRFGTVVELARALEGFGSAHSRGAAGRISAVFYAIPTTVATSTVGRLDADTQRAATFDTPNLHPRTAVARIAFAGGVMLVAGVLVGALLLVAGSTKPRADGASEEPANAAAARPSVPAGGGWSAAAADTASPLRVEPLDPLVTPGVDAGAPEATRRKPVAAAAASSATGTRSAPALPPNTKPSNPSDHM